MTFIGILQNIGKVVAGVDQVAGPILTVAFPAAAGPLAALDAIFQRLLAGIVTVEVKAPADGNGPEKNLAVVADFDAGLALTQSVLAMEHKHLTYDPHLLAESIAAQVAAFNAMAALKASFRISDKPR